MGLKEVALIAIEAADLGDTFMSTPMRLRESASATGERSASSESANGIKP